MGFTNKTEAYLYAIYVLDSMMVPSTPPRTLQLIQQEIESIKVCVENHEQDPGVVARILDALSANSQITFADQLALRAISKAMSENTYVQTEEDKWKNPIGRRAESELQLALLQYPTYEMMASVKKISDQLVVIFDNKLVLECSFQSALQQDTSYQNIWMRK